MTNHATLNYKAPQAAAQDLGPRWLVQLHPLELDRGPIELDDASTLGRSDDCTIKIDDESVSRFHAEIRRVGASYQILDLNSTNGVLVNECRVDSTMIRSGDRIQLGARIFRFLANNDFESQYHETVYSMMTRDGLTGVYNKRYLLEALDREVARCKRYARSISVAMMDVDHFKKINDTYGHLIGDEVLKELPRRVQNLLREDEIFGRFGGEEFALVMVEADREHALDVAERCRHAIGSSPFHLAAGDLDVTISIGVASPAIEALSTPAQLLHQADAFLYQAKRAGRNQVAG